MKKVFLILGVFLIVLLTILIVNTFTFSSKQLVADKAEHYSLQEQDAVQRFKKAIQFKTVSNDQAEQIDSAAFEAFNQFLATSFPLVYQNLELKKINTFGLLFYWKGTQASLTPGLLMGHYDVVPAENASLDKWVSPPFKAEEKENIITGRGTIDDKNNVMAILEAVSYLLSQHYTPERSLYIAFGHDEEVGGQYGAKAIASYLQEKNVALEYVLDEGGIIKKDGISGFEHPIALVGFAEKGYVSLKLTANAIGGHSSMPEKETSITILAEALHKLSDHPFPSRLKGAPSVMFDYIGPEMPFGQKLVFANQWLLRPVLEVILSKSAASNATIRTTMVPTIFRAGVKDNVIPTEASVVINFRIIPGETVKEVKDYVKQTIADERIKIEEEQGFAENPSKVSELDSPVFTALNQTIRSYYPEAIVTPYIVVGATDSRHYKALTNNIFRFSPIMIDNTAIKAMHGINEQLDRATYLKSISFYIGWIKAQNDLKD